MYYPNKLNIKITYDILTGGGKIVKMLYKNINCFNYLLISFDELTILLEL